MCCWKCQCVFAGCDAVWTGLGFSGGVPAAQRWPGCHMDRARLRPRSQRSWAEICHQQCSLCYGLRYHSSLWAWGTRDVLCVLRCCDRCRVYFVNNRMSNYSYSLYLKFKLLCFSPSNELPYQPSNVCPPLTPLTLCTQIWKNRR